MGPSDIGLLIFSTAAFITGTFCLFFFIKNKIKDEIWNPLFITIASFTDITNTFYLLNNTNNIHIINIYCLIEPFLFFLIWTKGNILKRKPLIIFLFLYGLFISFWLLERSFNKETYAAFSTFWYSLFFSYVFINMLADSIVRSFSDKSSRIDLFFFLGLVMYLSFDVVTGLFDKFYNSFSHRFYQVTGMIRVFNMMIVYTLFSYYNLCKISKRASSWLWGSVWLLY